MVHFACKNHVIVLTHPYEMAHAPASYLCAVTMQVPLPSHPFPVTSRCAFDYRCLLKVRCHGFQTGGSVHKTLHRRSSMKKCMAHMLRREV